ncbi:MAG: malto-oligosyltrehalose synthase [Chlamydiota bacterium]|nr:malto-oligosyltrehalose synthase [Chlamydiota bacterium]
MTIPVATYRLQLNHEFQLNEAVIVTDYLNSLGVSQLYLSPILKAKSGSLHGYDVVDYSKINPEIGSEKELLELSRKVKSLNMGIILDIVPNHMCVNTLENSYWKDLLKYGKESKFADLFDIFWDEISETENKKFFLPVLEGNIQDEIKKGTVEIIVSDDGSYLKFYDHLFPLKEANLESQDILEILEKQFYCLDDWKHASKNLQYRRFFDVNDLACVRLEDKNVYDRTHAKIFDWMEKGLVDGLRVDHVDGLRQPVTYLQNLKEKCDRKHLYIEKILCGEEKLRDDWPVEGTTGYEFLNHLNQLFIYPDSFSKLTQVFNAFTGNKADVNRVINKSKQDVIEKVMVAEVNRLAKIFHRQCPKIDINTCYQGIKALLINFPIYRTYFCDASTNLKVDYKIILEAITKCEISCVEIAPTFWEKLKDCFLSQKNKEFIARFQQTTGPVMAKGYEDTTLYRFFPLASMNEVGGELEQYSDSIERFHRLNNETKKQFPLTMLATTTHDTKRSEDVRARINVLSEHIDLWQSKLLKWKKMAQSSIDSKHEYLIYQTIIGTYPHDKLEGDDLVGYQSRISEYALKSAKEGKEFTSWLDPNLKYENSLKDFVSTVLSDNGEIHNDIYEFLKANILYAAYYNSLSQVVLKSFSPGVPDFYQGSEFWTFTLVDPDNRKKVIFPDSISANVENWSELVQNIKNGNIKQYLTRTCLHIRKWYPNLFVNGEYEPIEVIGKQSEHVLAFARSDETRAFIIVTGRFFSKIFDREKKISTDIWSDTLIKVPEEFKGKKFYNHITRESYLYTEEINLKNLFVDVPFAILEFIK